MKNSKNTHRFMNIFSILYLYTVINISTNEKTHIIYIWLLSIRSIIVKPGFSPTPKIRIDYLISRNLSMFVFPCNFQFTIRLADRSIFRFGRKIKFKQTFDLHSKPKIVSDIYFKNIQIFFLQTP